MVLPRKRTLSWIIHACAMDAAALLLGIFDLRYSINPNSNNLLLSIR